MTIEQISESKLKITLLFSEFAAYELSGPDLHANSPKLKKFIVSIIRKAMRETGFEASGANIMIESVPKEDCLIFFITKFDSSHKKSEKKKLNPPAFKVRKQVASLEKNSYAFFVFPDEKSFVDFLFSVKNEDFSSSFLYTMEGRYYFKTRTNSRLYTHALEFANPVCSQMLALKLAKDGTLICSGENFYKII